jgi:ribosomal protein L14E/L6E/L27E
VNILSEHDLLGRVVRSKAGRDVGKFYVIVKILDDRYVFISDGKQRTEEKPKKKRLKHLDFTDLVAENIKLLVLENKQISNSVIRKFLQLNDIDKEV